VSRLVNTLPGCDCSWATFVGGRNLDVGPGAIQAAIVHAGRREGIVSGIGDTCWAWARARGSMR
jgi:hypothetical protein